MGEKKENFLNTRIDDLLLSKIEKYAATYNLKKSKIIRNALDSYIRFTQKDEMSKTPYMVVTKREFAFLLDRINEEDLKKFAKMSYDSAMIIKKNLVEDYLQLEEIKQVELTSRFFMSSLEHFLFSYKGQNWMSSVKQYFHKNKYYFSCKHVLNLAFSNYVKLLLDLFMKEYDFIPFEIQLDEKEIYLVYQKS